MCDYTIDNNGDLARLKKNVDVLINTIFKHRAITLPLVGADQKSGDKSPCFHTVPSL
jgi:hypothetical protein